MAEEARAEEGAAVMGTTLSSRAQGALSLSLSFPCRTRFSRLRVCFFSGVALTPAGLRAGREICAHPTGDKASQRALYKDMNSVSSQLAGVIENLRSQMNQLDAGARARNSRRL